MEMDEKIKALIEEYNKTELEQADRLRVLFDWMNDERTGYRHVMFGNYVWYNSWCWDWERQSQAQKKLVDSHIKQITHVETGEPVKK